MTVNQIAWRDVKHHFAFDGAWLDVFVLNTDLIVWQRVLHALAMAGYENEYFIDSKKAKLPEAAAVIFAQREERNTLLSIRFSGVLANGYFITTDEIEFDIDPREVTGQAQLNGLLEFMQRLADSAGTDAILCPENCSRVVLLRVVPNSDSV